jgi:hypothetical protein
MANSIFKPGKMASKNVDSYLRNIECASDLENGNVVRLLELKTRAIDTWVASTPSDVTAQEVFIVDEPVRNLIGGKYAIDVADPREFYIPAGRTARARKAVMGDTCYISIDGLASTPTVGQYVVPANTSYVLAPAANLSGATLVAFKVVAEEKFFVGADTVNGYRLEVVVAV